MKVAVIAAPTSLPKRRVAAEREIKWFIQGHCRSLWQNWELQRLPWVPAQYIKHKLNLLLPSTRSEAGSGILCAGAACQCLAQGCEQKNAHCQLRGQSSNIYIRANGDKHQSLSYDLHWIYHSQAQAEELVPLPPFQRMLSHAQKYQHYVPMGLSWSHRASKFSHANKCSLEFCPIQ